VGLIYFVVDFHNLSDVCRYYALHNPVSAARRMSLSLHSTLRAQVERMPAIDMSHDMSHNVTITDKHRANFRKQRDRVFAL
jgi:hypothetical protein